VSLWPSSPRRRRRLAWISTAPIAIAAVTAVFVFIPSHSGATKELDGVFVESGSAVGVDKSRRADATLASGFIHDLAARRNLNARFADLTPTYQRRYPHSAWTKGLVPISPQRLKLGSDRFAVQSYGATPEYLVEIPRERTPPYEYYAITIDHSTGKPLVAFVADRGVVEPVIDTGSHLFGNHKAPNWLLASVFYGVVSLAALALAAVAFIAIRRARRAGKRFAYPDKPMPTLPGSPKQPDADHGETRDGSV
jgi:hypothetical protein